MTAPLRFDDEGTLLDTPRCYRVTLYDAAKRLSWSPVFAAGSEAEAVVKAAVLFDKYAVRGVSLIHDKDDHWAIEGRQTLLERRMA